MVSDEKVMSTSSKRIHEVKHTFHLMDESKDLVIGTPRSHSTFTFHVHIQKQKHRTHKQMFTQAFPRSNSETKTPDSQTDVYTGISTFKFRNKNTGLTNRCLKLTIHRTEPYSLMSLLYFCGHLEYIPGAHPCREMFGFQLFTQKKAPSQIP